MNALIKILHLEDVRSDADLVKRAMSKSGISFEWRLATSKPEFEKALREFNPDIILSDHTLPSFTSLDALKLARHAGLRVPFILITATVSEEFAVTMIKEGVSDYLLKDRLQRLPSAVTSALEKWKAELDKEEHLAELIESENRFRALIEHSHDMLALLNDEGIIEYASPAVNRILGFSNAHPQPANIKDIVHPSDLVQFHKLIVEAIERPSSPMMCVMRVRKNDGAYIWIEGTLTNLLHLSGVSAVVFNFRDISSRKAAEDKIRRSEANLHAIIENSDASIYSLDKNLRYITFNKQLENTLEKIYDLDIKEGDNVLEFLKKLDPREAEEWEAAYTSALSGKALHFEKEINIGNHHSVTSFSINPIRENDLVTGLACFATDMTKQREAQQKLRDSEERYRNIVETAQEGIWIIDQSNKTTFVNKKLADILEYSQEEMIDKDFFFFTDKDSEHLVKESIELRKKAIHETLELKFITKTGKEVWTSLSSSSLFDAHGNYLGALAMVNDITNKKIYHESLIKSEANIRNIFDNTHVGYVLLDPALKIVSYNQVAVSSYLAVMNKALMKGNDLLDYFFDDRKADVKIKLQKVLKKERVNYEVQYDLSDGNTAWFKVHLSPVLATNHEVLGIVTAVTDITERKESELQKEKITAELLRQNKDLEQFAYIVSHNLRAPVANILGICNLLKDQSITSLERAEVDDHILASAQKLDDVVLDLSHILQIKRELNEGKQLVKFSDLITEIETSISGILKRESASITTRFEGVNEFITLRSYLYSIFYNLITNSLKYRQRDISPHIEVYSEKDKNKIRLFFKDNGIGIDLKKNREKIFGLYRRFHVLHAEGKGIGLFMVKTQVEALGGTVSINSEVNRGTEFKIEFEL